MKAQRTAKKKLFIRILFVTALLFVGAGVWYGSKVYSAHQLAGRINELSFEELIREALSGKSDARVTVGIIKDGQRTYTVYGADAEALGQTEYRYEIGSITKTMTAMLLAQAVQEDKLLLTDTIDMYLELPAGKAYPTIASLLTHTSGLDGYYFEWSMLPYVIHSEKNPFRGITGDKLLEEYRDTDLMDGREYGYEYSNYGFALLGLVIEKVYGEDYTSLVNGYLRENLAMKDTYVSNGDADFNGNWIWEADDAYIPAGAIVSDISDMLAYADAQLNDDSIFALCHQPLKQVNASDKWDRMGGFCVDEIGMSWIIDTEHGFVWHNGGTGAHTSYLGFCPAEDTAVVVLSNLSMDEDIPATTIGFKKLMEISQE